MKTVTISLPMSGRNYSDILNNIISATEKIKEKYEGVQIISPYVHQIRSTTVKNIPVYYLGESIKTISECDAVYFCKGWESSRGCIIEHSVCEHYGIEIVYEG